MTFLNYAITFDTFRLIQQHVLKNTCVQFDKNVVSYCCQPLIGGPTLEIWDNMRQHNGMIYGPGTFTDLRDVINLNSDPRRVLVRETGFTICFATKDNNTRWQYINTANYKLQPNTRALIVSGGVTFEEEGMQKQANVFNLINKRQYELNLVGNAELILIQ